MELLEENILCGKIPKISYGPWMQELKQKKIWISDLGKTGTDDIVILIGSDYWADCLTGKILQLNCGLTAIQTIFGWTVSGRLNKPTEESTASCMSSLFVGSATLQDLWNLEAIGIREEPASTSIKEKELAVKRHFLETVKNNDHGRYSVSLPWTSISKEMPNNRKVAETRLKIATAKLDSTNKFHIYNDVFESWLNEDFIEDVPPESMENPCHYLPHRHVFKPESTTTPVRPVFDASCKTGRAPSLNECLEKGPNLMELIPDLILRFREKKIGVIADIRKAFQMIEVDESDRDFLRFIWWGEERKKLRIFRHRRVVFGVNCSPFLLAAVLDYHLSAVDGESKQIALQLKNSFYVDNCVTSVDTYAEYIRFRDICKQLLLDAKMDLRQWEHTAVEVVDTVIDEQNMEEELSPSRVTSVLGMKWNKEDDTLSCVIPEKEIPQKITKRYILSQIQRIFDPMGFLGPALLPPKLMLQRAWANNVGWDQELDPEVEKDFSNWWNQVSVLSAIKIPRHSTKGISTIAKDMLQIHSFGDASGEAISAVVYLRAVCNGNVSVQLLQAKARVAPMKKHTIPRLELVASLIAARLTNSVKKALDYHDVHSYYWTDSTTALSWIWRNDDWGTFVGNRVREILTLTNANNWRHIPGHLNPADLPSRGCSPSKLLASRWWEGPEWLIRSPDEWPVYTETVDEALVLQERKKTSVVMVVAVDSEQDEEKITINLC